MSIPKKMLAIAFQHAGDANTLITNYYPTPLLKSGHVLIKVVAAGVNRPDIMQRQGRYPAPAGITSIFGLKVSGTSSPLHPTYKHSTLATRFVLSSKAAVMPNTVWPMHNCAYLFPIISRLLTPPVYPKPFLPSGVIYLTEPNSKKVKPYWFMAGPVALGRRPYNWPMLLISRLSPPPPRLQNVISVSVSALLPLLITKHMTL